MIPKCGGLNWVVTMYSVGTLTPLQAAMLYNKTFAISEFLEQGAHLLNDFSVSFFNQYFNLKKTTPYVHRNTSDRFPDVGGENHSFPGERFNLLCEVLKNGPDHKNRNKNATYLLHFLMSNHFMHYSQEVLVERLRPLLEQCLKLGADPYQENNLFKSALDEGTIEMRNCLKDILNISTSQPSTKKFSK